MSAPLRFKASDYFSQATSSVSGLAMSNPDVQATVSSRSGEMLGVNIVKPGTSATDCKAVRDQCIASFKHEYESVANEYDKVKLADDRKKKCLSALGSVAKWIGIGIATVATGGLFGIWYGKRQSQAIFREVTHHEKISDTNLHVEGNRLVKCDESFAEKKDRIQGEIQSAIAKLTKTEAQQDLDKGFQDLAKKVESFRLSAETEMLELKAGFSANAMENLTRVKDSCRRFVDWTGKASGTNVTPLQKAVNAFKDKFKDSPSLVRKIDAYVDSSKGILSEKIINAIVKSKGARAMLEDISFGKDKGKREVESLIGYGLETVLNEVVKQDENERSRFAENEFVRNYGRLPNLRNAKDRDALEFFGVLHRLKTEPSFNLTLQPDQQDLFRNILKTQFMGTDPRDLGLLHSDTTRGTTLTGKELLLDDNQDIPNKHKPILRGFVTQQALSLVGNLDLQKCMGLQGWSLCFSEHGDSLGKLTFQKCQGKDNTYQFSYDYKTPVTNLITQMRGTKFVYGYKVNPESAGDDKPMVTLKFDLTVELKESGEIKDVTVGKDVQMRATNLGAAHGTLQEDET